MEEVFIHSRMGPAFKAIKHRWHQPTINKANRSPCDSPDEILQRWREHFEAALNHLPGTHSAELDAEQIDATTDQDISVDKPSLDEVTSAIRKLRNGRAAGPDRSHPSYSNVHLIRSRRLCTKFSSRFGE